jgi:hypothetical protein
MSHLRSDRPAPGRRLHLLAVVLAIACALVGVPVATASAALAVSRSAQSSSVVLAAATEGTSLEAVASKAGETGRKVAMSLIGLGLAVAAIVLAFRRDFREAVVVCAVGIVCVLLATPAGESLLRNTVNTLVGS